MSRYIDADKLIKSIEKRRLIFKGTITVAEALESQGKVIREEIENAPTADVVEVVRCKDCKHYNNGECAYHSEPKEMRMYERWTVDVDDNDFCSCGERSEE